MDRQLVHHLNAAGDNAGGDDAADAGAGFFDGGKADQQGAGAFGLAQNPHRDLGDDAEQPLGSDHDAEQIVAGRIEMLAAEPQDLAGDQHHLAAEHIICGQPVFEAVHAAGILRHIAPDRAGDLRGRIGRVIESLVLHRLGDGEIGDAGLHHGDAVGEVHLADALEFSHAEEDAVAERQRPSGQRGAGAARYHFDAVPVAIAQHAGDVIGGTR